MTDYTYLVNDIINACENDGTEFIAYVPNMVNRSEERLTRDLDDYGLVVQTSIAVSSGNSEVTLPAGTRIVKNFNIINNGSKINLLLKTDEYLNAVWPISASTETPRYYSRVTDTRIRLAPTPASTSDGILMTVARPTTLTSASNTNYFTEICYDALFNAAMVEAMVFTKNYTAVQLFEQRYTQAIETLRNQARRTRRDDMAAPASPAGGDNTIIAYSN
tara:strand:+ start:1084 stop:1740 length:657 start_codon:yes stop_codon:yes gene_type:complete